MMWLLKPLELLFLTVASCCHTGPGRSQQFAQMRIEGYSHSAERQNSFIDSRKVRDPSCSRWLATRECMPQNRGELE
jgi:hypothetical protein